MTWKDEVAGISGAALGFITADVPGAYTGYKLAKKLSKNSRRMARIKGTPRRQSRGVYPTPSTPYTPTRRSNHVFALPVSTRSDTPRRNSGHSVYSSASQRSGVTTSTGISTRLPNVKVKAKRKKFARITHGKKHKKVHVSKKLREKIKKVVEGDQKNVFGYFQTTCFDQFQNAFRDQQSVHYFPQYASQQVTKLSGMYFSPIQVLHAASRLFNGKIANITPSVNDERNFDPNTVKINVRKQWVINRYHNDSNRTLIVKFLIIKPKQYGIDIIADGPIAKWAAILSREAQNPAQVGNALTFTPGMNITNSSITTLWNMPKSGEWKKYFEFVEEEVTFEPGQTWEHTLDGPQMVYDYSKFFGGGSAPVQINSSAGDFQNIQKFNTIVVGIIINDIINNSDGIVTSNFVGRAPASTNNYLLMESTYHVKLDMPEPTGWVNNATPTLTAGQNITLGNRRSAFAIDVFQLGTLVTGHRVDEQNPSQVGI